jgi:hypothetical protein
VIDDPTDAVAQLIHAEVDQQPNVEAAQAEIGQELALMDDRRALGGFDFHDNPLVHEEIQPIAQLHACTLVLEWQDHLPIYHEPSLPELYTEQLLIRRLESSRPNPAMNAKRLANDRIRNVVD